MSSPTMPSPQQVVDDCSMNPSPKHEQLDEPQSPPAMLATMTPVNVMELQKDFEESQKNEMYLRDREIYYGERNISPEQIYQNSADIVYDNDSKSIYDKESALYTHEIVEKQPQIDLIYEDGKNTVIYTTTNDQKSLEIYSQNRDLDPINGNIMNGELEGGNGVSVVVQGGLQYPPPTGATVLVLSELINDDINQVQRRRRDPPLTPGSPGMAGDEYPMATHNARYYEHPLTAATTALLNVSGGSSAQEEGSNNVVTSTPIFYEYYKIPDSKDITWSTPTTNSQLKTTNSVTAPPIDMASSLSQHEIQGLLLGTHHPAFAQAHGVKREPEDLSHKKQDQIKQGRQKVLVVTSSNSAQDLAIDVSSHQIKEELSRIQSPHSPNSPQQGGDISGGELKNPAMFSTQVFMTNSQHGSGTPSPVSYSDQYGQVSQNYVTQIRPGSSTAFVGDTYYREYFPTAPDQYSTIRQAAAQYSGGDSGGPNEGSFSANERYRQPPYKGVLAGGLTVDLPSPDSGIGADAITPRDQNNIQQSFDYTELCQPAGLLEGVVVAGGLHRGAVQQHSPGGTVHTAGVTQPSRSRPWHDFGRQNDADKIQIQKVFSACGFKYHLESPISSSQRREDDRITYINKGQFYGISLEFIHDPDKPLKSQTVKSIVMLMFREEKSPEDEIKAWQFWHGRQHSVKQRILDADTKNSVGLVGCIEEVSHNAIAVYWNPLESSAKINVAVQCLSTDFSSQKGVKGLPLHIQIDTFDDPRDPTVFHRGYCQIKVFCDKGAERKMRDEERRRLAEYEIGAERKTRDEERRAAKRKMTATGRKKLDELYHPVVERSEFYSMSDLNKPPVLFSPAEDIDKLTSMELQGFYGHDSSEGNSLGGGDIKGQSPFLLHAAPKPPATPTLKFHNHFPPDTPVEKKETMMETTLTSEFAPPVIKRPRLSPPPLNERVMLYVRQESEEVYTPLHVVPPTTQGLLNADYGQN